MIRIALLCVALALAGCQTTGGRYTGDSQYYWADPDGAGPRGMELHSCRDDLGCRVDAEWPDGGLSR